MTAGSQDLKVPPEFLPGDPELYQDYPVEIEADLLAADILVIFPENVPRRTLQVLKHNLGNKHPPGRKTVLSCMVVTQKKIKKKRK